LCPEHFDRLKDVYHALVSHSFQDDAKSDEDAGPANTGAATTTTEKTAALAFMENLDLMTSFLAL
jgi:hypothetical protein